MGRALEGACARARAELRDLLELFLLPGLAAVLPWPICYRLFRLVSGVQFLYTQQTEKALAAAADGGFVEDREAWKAAYRLTQLVDHADLYLSRFRSDRWLRRYVSAQVPTLPQGSGLLLVGFHWGVGMWVLRYLRSRGIRASFLSMAFDRRYFTGRSVRYWYARARMAEVERIGNSPVVYIGGSVQRMRTLLSQGASVVALIDVPPDRSDRGLAVRFLGLEARFPNGITRLAFEERMPLLTFTVGLNRMDGRRLLHIEGPVVGRDEQEMMDQIGGIFDRALRSDAPAWHCWALLERFTDAEQRV